MTILLLALFSLILLGISFLVIRKVVQRKGQQRRPRGRDAHPPHIQQQRILTAHERHLWRRTRHHGAHPPGEHVRLHMKTAGRSR